jgi:tRNA(fMet)-specific endonuclease VapC
VALIIDTNAVSALFAGDPALGQVLDSEPFHHLPVIVIGEYRYGVARSKHRRRLEGLLDLLVRESIVLLVDEETTRHYATIRETLRRAGSPIPENDVWIAALAQQHGESIVSRDRHFDMLGSLRRVAW